MYMRNVEQVIHEYYSCNLWNVRVYSGWEYEQHMQGKRHQENQRMGEWEGEKEG